MQPGHIVDERFVVEGLAGQGGMARVFRARDRASGEVVAVKVLLDEENNRERFEREAAILARLRHPGIVRHVAHGKSGPLSYIAMEWLEGESLSRRIGKQPLTIRGGVKLLRRLADALAEAHRHGVVHRDLKPSNVILVDGDLDRPKILDFGIARALGSTQELTRKGVLLGSMGYMAPEQARGARDLDARADVFALGCLLFHALTGKRLFDGGDALAFLVKVVIEDAPLLRTLRPDAPPSLEALLARMLARVPADRPASAAELCQALDAITDIELEESTIDAPAPPGLGAEERRVRCAILLRPRVDAEAEAPSAAASLAAPFEGAVDVLIDGHLLVTFGGGGAAPDEAARAARCALSLRASRSIAKLAIVAARSAGSALTGTLDPFLPVLDRAPEEAVAVDDVTAGLLGARFDVGGDAAGLYLHGERDVAEPARTLLGKPTPCVGRDGELSRLFHLFDEALRERAARAVILTGEAGIGKSRLRHELLRRIREGGVPVEVWIGMADPMSAASPFGLLASALRRTAGILPGEPLPLQQRKLRARVARHLDTIRAASVAEFLGELAGVPFAEQGRPQLAAARRNAMLMGDRIRRAFEDFVAAERRANPVLLVLEDLHWGDLPSVRLVDTVLGQPSAGPLFVLAIGRPEVARHFPDLWSSRAPVEIPLGPLDPAASRELLRAALGPRAKSALLSQLAARAGGNAFYLEELVRAEAQGKRGDLPESVLAMVQAMLENLPPRARRVLRAASFFGDAFGREGLAALLGDDAGDLEAMLSELLERELIERREQSRTRLGGLSEQYAFRAAHVREAAYAMLTSEDRALGHNLAARYLLEAGETDPTRLAEHLERAGEPEQAAQHYLRAALQALGGNDLLRAIARAERGVACGATGDALGRLLIIQAEAYRWRGENLEAMRAAAEAIAVLPTGSDTWCGAASELAACTIKLGEPKPLEPIAHALREPWDGPGEGARPAQIVACARVASPLYLFGFRALADTLLERASAHAAALQDPMVRARIGEAHVIAAYTAGDPAAAAALAEATAADFAEMGDARSVALQRSNQGAALNSMGAYAEAERALREALTAAEPLGLVEIVSAAQQNLGFALAHMGRLDEAQSFFSRSIREAVLQRNRRLEAGARIYMAVASMLAGNMERAEPDARAAADALPDGRPLKAYALGTLAMIELLRGRMESAMQAAEHGMKVLAAHGGVVEEGEAMLRLAYAEALLQCGDREGGLRALAIARRRVEERAAGISKLAWRQSFLAMIPECRRTLELSERMGTA